MKAIAYLRFSPRPQGKVDKCESIEVQADRCLAYAGIAGLDVIEEIEDRETSAGQPLAERDGGGRLVARLNEVNGPKHVIVHRLDRIFRSTSDGLLQMEVWNHKGITLHLAAQNGVMVDSSTATGKLILTMLLAQSSFERDIIVERTSDSMKRHQESGRRMTRPDKLPYGEMPDPNDPSRTVPCSYEVNVINRILALHSDGMSLRKICRQLEADGISPRGKEWRHGTIKSIINRHSA